MANYNIEMHCLVYSVYKLQISDMTLHIEQFQCRGAKWSVLEKMSVSLKSGLSVVKLQTAFLIFPWIFKNIQQLIQLIHEKVFSSVLSDLDHGLHHTEDP